MEIVPAAAYDAVRARLAEAAVAVWRRGEGSGSWMKLLNYTSRGKEIVARGGSALGLVDGVAARVALARDAEGVVARLHDAPPHADLGRAARASVGDHTLRERVPARIEAVHRRVAGPRSARPLAAPARGAPS